MSHLISKDLPFFQWTLRSSGDGIYYFLDLRLPCLFSLSSLFSWFWIAWTKYKSEIICPIFSLSTCWELEVQFHCLCGPVSEFPALRSLQLSNARTFFPCNCGGTSCLNPTFHPLQHMSSFKSFLFYFLNMSISQGETVALWFLSKEIGLLINV